MAEVRPFRGLRFNPGFTGDIGSIICPPYDVISSEQQRILHERSPYNIVRLENGIIRDGDTAKNNRHIRSASLLAEWIEKGAIQYDGVPALYLHDHNFGTGRKIRRRGFIACVRLEPPEKRTVLPHENTVPGIKSDRLALLKACRTNISPIFLLYQDPDGGIAELLEQSARQKPVDDFVTPEEERHRVWKIEDPRVSMKIAQLLSGQTIYIADGHHRYETCAAYQQEMVKQRLVTTGKESFNYVMVTLVPFDDPGLVVYPIHRVVHGMTDRSMGVLKTQLERFFELEYVPATGACKSARLLKETGSQFIVLGLKEGKAAICRVKAGSEDDKLMPKRSDAYRRLPVSLLHHLALDPALDSTGSRGSITYTHDESEAIDAMNNRVCNAAVLLPPTDPATIKDIADAGDRMPGKSTYFYPKLPTGIVLHSLED